MSFKKAKLKDEKDLVSCFQTDLKNCLYSYIDLVKYGFGNINLEFYINGKNSINSVATRYYNGVTLFSPNCPDEVFDLENIEKLIRDLSPDMVNGSSTVIEKVESHLSDCYIREDGFVTQLRLTPKTMDDSNITMAKEEDYMEIAKLICSDEGLGGQYKVKDLKEQLLDRKREGFGRNYIWRENGQIVCHGATYAELSDIAVVSGVITREDYRGRQLAYKLVSKLCKDLADEGKQVFLFYFTKEAQRLYQKIGFEEGSCWSKLILKK